MENLECQIIGITWRDARSGRSILRVRIPPRAFTTVVGVFSEVNIGDRVRLDGHWKKHPKFGDQFETLFVEILPPDELEIAQRYLSSGLFHGLGPKSAELLLARYGTKTLATLDADPTHIASIRGFGLSRAKRFELEWYYHQKTRPDYLALLRLQLPLSLVHRWIKKHGDKSLVTLELAPFKLTEEPWDLGFHRADSIAKKLGLAPDAPERLRAALRYCLEKAIQDGHCYLPQKECIIQAEKLLYLDQDDLAQRLELALDLSLKDEQIIQKDQRLYLPWLYRAETQVSQNIFQLMQRKTLKLHADSIKSLKNLHKITKISYSDEQKKAIEMALCEPLMILTGGPGTGKTSTLLGILTLLEERKVKTLLAAPTGRAARRMEEVSGKSATTIHRLLEYQGDTHECQRNADRPLSCEVLVLDEVSMLDLGLMESLLDALPRDARLILVGDQNQLPSVGPGSILADLLSLPQIPRVSLTQVFRQAEENDIPHNAQKILSGEVPHSLAKPTHFHIRALEDSSSMQEKILQLVCDDIPKHFNCDPFDDIQVLCPMKKGPTGIEELNLRMQERLLPIEKKIPNMPFRIGDKVMQIRNNYDKDVFNGDIGIVLDLDVNEETLQVQFEDVVEYTWQEMDELQLAYAITVHKSQGSEYPFVVLVLDPDHQVMLQRRLLYTAVTRAKERLFIIMRGYALHDAVANLSEKVRYSHLKERLSAHFEFENCLKN